MDRIKLAEGHAGLLVPPEEGKRRLARFRAALEREGIDLAWITHGADLLYFSGTDQRGVLSVPVRGEPTLFAKKAFARARLESFLEDIRPGARPGEMADEARAGLGAVRRLGLCLDILPAAQFLRFQEAFEGVETVDVSGIVRDLRSVKSPWEIDQIRRATRRTQEIFRGMGEIFQPGITELELSVRMEGMLRRDGHSGLIRLRGSGQEFAILVLAAGPSGAYPTKLDGPVGFEGPFPSAGAGGGHRVIREGDAFIVDIVGQHNGYHSDNARTFVAGGEPNPVVSVAHEFCRDVLGELVGRLLPGESCAQIFEDVSRRAQTRGEPEGFMGFGENRIRFFGHGVGVELDEFPVIAKGFDRLIEKNMVIALEPKAFHPEFGPAGLENTYLITDEGARSLCEAEEGIVAVG